MTRMRKTPGGFGIVRSGPRRPRPAYFQIIEYLFMPEHLLQSGRTRSLAIARGPLSVLLQTARYEGGRRSTDCTSVRTVYGQTSSSTSQTRLHEFNEKKGRTSECTCACNPNSSLQKSRFPFMVQLLTAAVHAIGMHAAASTFTPVVYFSGDSDA